MLRCFVSDKVDVKLLIPVCNTDREKAIALAAELVCHTYIYQSGLNKIKKYSLFF